MDVGGQDIERAVELLREIVRLVGVEVDVHVDSGADGVVLDLQGDDSGLLIGRRGQMLDALEYLVNRSVFRDSHEAPRLVVDSLGYRERRREAVEEMAREAADEVRRTGRPVSLEELNPRDRRTVHLLFGDDPDVSTASFGTGADRAVTIHPRRDPVAGS